MSHMETRFLVMPMWFKQKLIDRYGSLQDALKHPRVNAGSDCVGIHFCAHVSDLGEKYLWDGTRVI